jgi:hypothetical protein
MDCNNKHSIAYGGKRQRYARNIYSIEPSSPIGGGSSGGGGLLARSRAREDRQTTREKLRFEARQQVRAVWRDTGV